MRHSWLSKRHLVFISRNAAYLYSLNCGTESSAMLQPAQSKQIYHNDPSEFAHIDQALQGLHAHGLFYPDFSE